MSRKATVAFYPEREVIAVAGIMRIRRTHGIFGGLLVALLGIWGALIPFVGPYFNYAYTPDSAWTYTSGRFWLEILPGVGVLIGGLLIIAARSRHAVLFGALLAIAGGAWFALGNVFAPLWTSSAPAGVPASSGATMRALEQVGFFTGLGIAIVLVAAAVAGRITAVPGLPAVAERPTVPARVPATRQMPVPASRRPVDTAESGEAAQAARAAEADAAESKAAAESSREAAAESDTTAEAKTGTERSSL